MYPSDIHRCFSIEVMTYESTYTCKVDFDWVMFLGYSSENTSSFARVTYLEAVLVGSPRI